MEGLAAFLVCALWGLIYAAIFLVVVEIVAWAASAVFGVGLPARAVQLLRIIAVLIFLVYLVSCFSGTMPGPMVVD